MEENRNEQLAIDRFVEYIRIETVHPRPDYTRALIFLKNYADEIQLQYSLITIDEDRHAAILTWPSMTSPNEKSILLNSHMDVVPVFEDYWIVPPFSGEIRDGKIYGRGTQDMKCVGIQYLEAIRRLKAKDYQPKRTIHCLFVPDEEIGGARGMKALIKLEQFQQLNIGIALDEGLASETDVYQVYYGTRSGMWLEFVVQGSHLMDNSAGEKAAILLNEMLSFRASEEKQLNDSQMTAQPLQLGEITTINLTKMSGGIQLNVVPDRFTLCFDCRIKPNGYESFQTFLSNTVDRISKANVDEVKINYLANDGPLPLTDIQTTSWWLECFKRTFHAMNCKINWTIFPAGTDSRFLRKVGYPAIGFSPIINTPVLLHDHNEYLPVDVFLRGIDIYVQLIINLTDENSLII